MTPGTPTITKGFRFLHATWKSPAFSFAQYKGASGSGNGTGDGGDARR